MTVFKDQHTNRQLTKSLSWGVLSTCVNVIKCINYLQIVIYILKS